MRTLILTMLIFAIVSGAVAAAPKSDVATIRALRLENNDAIASHDVALMQRAWSPEIRLVESDGSSFAGAASLAASYRKIEFNDPSFVAYVRRPMRIVVSPDGTRASESGAWTAIYESPKHVGSGTYLASWRKYGSDWKIVYEAYISLGLAPQSVADVLKPSATVALGGTPDWLVVTADSVWVSNGARKAVQRIDTRTNKLIARVNMPGRPCSGLTYGFGSVWVPLCGLHPSLVRVDPATNAIIATLPIGPALSEGGITASTDSIWMATRTGTLARIDPATNRVRQTISIAPGSYNPLYSNGIVWITSGEKNLLTAVDASNGKVVATIPVGPKPRFLTAGDGMVWTLNQGDGSVSKIRAATKRVIATVDAGIPGGGGEITYGAGSAWATIIGVPITRIDARTNLTRQWGGRGGDAVRFGRDSIWLTDYYGGILWRIPTDRIPSLAGMHATN